MSIVSPDHWIEGVQRSPIHGGAPMLTRRCVVIHFTAGATGKSSIEFWRTPSARGTSAHIVIERDGTVIQVRPFNRTCGHAGVSRWVDPQTGTKYTNLNSCSIGIELANAGDSVPALSWARKQPGFGSVKLRHRNGGRIREWELYPTAQTLSCIEVCKALVRRYNLDDITGHDCIAPERKVDPGPAFQMEVVRKECGFSGLPEVHQA